MIHLDYKSYLKKRLKKANLTDHFDVDGNSSLATANRSFLSEVKLQVSPLNRDIKTAFNSIREVARHGIVVSALILLPIFYIPILIARAMYQRRRAEDEMRSDWRKNK